MTPSAIPAFCPPLSPPDDSPSSPSAFSVLVCWISPTSDEEGVGEGVGAGDESGEGDGEDSKACGGAGGDPKYGDGEGAVGESGGDNVCGDGATSSAPLSGAGAGDNSGGSTATANSTKSNTAVSAMQNLNNLAIAKSSLYSQKKTSSKPTR